MTAPDDTKPPVELCRFLARCHRGEHWLAHEELEPLWLRERDGVLKGLIHIAAGLLHAERGNRRGARSKLASAARLLQGSASASVSRMINGIRQAELVDALHEIIAALGSGAVSASLDVSDYFPAALREAPIEDVTLPYRVRRYDRGYRPWRGEPTGPVSDSRSRGRPKARSD